MSADWLGSGLSTMASSLRGSSILAIAAQVRELVASGREVCNLTIGDFNPNEYPVPERLRDALVDAIRAGQTNYPPSNGMPELRAAIARFHHTRLGVEVDPIDVIVASGARPLLYATYRALVDRGDKVVYGAPSWNNSHYAQMLGAEAVQLAAGPESGFFPTMDLIAPHLHDARLLVLNSPSNPTGTCIRRDDYAELCTAIVDENDRRKVVGQRPLFLLHDQIYWLLTFGDVKHIHPVAIEPRMADYAISVDGISKAFAATGLRVGWATGPKQVIAALNRISGHVGAWAPKPMQIAAAALISDDAAVDGYMAWIRTEAHDRLALLHRRLIAIAGDRLPIRALEPEGAIYLSVEFALRGCTLDGRTIETPDDVRRLLLDEVGMAVVPFDAFGASHATDWYRLSVGAVSRATLATCLDRLEQTMARVVVPAGRGAA